MWRRRYQERDGHISGRFFAGVKDWCAAFFWCCVCPNERGFVPQELRVDITVYHQDNETFDETKFPQFFRLSGEISAPASAPVASAGQGGEDSSDDDLVLLAEDADGAAIDVEDDGVIVLDGDVDVDTVAAAVSSEQEGRAKRARDSPGVSSAAGKRARVETTK